MGLGPAGSRASGCFPRTAVEDTTAFKALAHENALFSGVHSSRVTVGRRKLDISLPDFTNEPKI